MNSIVDLLYSWLVQADAVDSNTKHPPGSTNFASGLDELMFRSNMFRSRCSEIFLTIDWTSSAVSRIKVAKDETGATKFDVLESETVSNSGSSCEEHPMLTVTLPVVLASIFFGDVAVTGRMRIVSQQSLLLENADGALDATMESNG